MNANIWPTASLHQLLRYLRDQLSPRQARLIACAGVRQIPGAQRSRGGEAITLAERFADGQATAHQLAAARYGGRFLPGDPAWAVCWGPDQDAAQMMERALAWVVGLVAQLSYPAGIVPIERHLAELIREIVGNPFQQRAIDPIWRVWNEGTVVRLAQSIYADRTFDQMPILGDALEEAGCGDQVLLDHCRSATAHERGCWVVDAILGKR